MSKKILVIDDEPDLVDVVKARLELNHYQVISAKDGQEGLEKVKKEKPDLVILDIMMPRMDGYTFVLEFKKIADLKKTPIIVLTAKDQLQDIFKVEGVTEYVVKPFESEKLIEKVDRLLATS
ncbi:MAG: response regulator [Candidatus Omnitrophota bacterium]